MPPTAVPRADDPDRPERSDRSDRSDLAERAGRTGSAERPAPLLRTILGEVLRRERTEQGRTLADVAAAATVSMPYLSEVERGRKEASSEVLAAVCGALRIDLAEVVTEAGRGLAEQSVVRARAAHLRAVRSERAKGSRQAIVSIAPRMPTAARRMPAGGSDAMCRAA